MKKLSKKDTVNVPSSAGVYLFLQGNTILYVGKSTNLKARIASHLENAKLDAKEGLIINSSDGLKYIVTESEFKALLLESELIQKYKPKYNVRFKDDKSYLYIKITPVEDYPKVLLSRKPNFSLQKKDRSFYFGPFASVAEVNEIVREIRKIIPFCTQKKISKKPCFYSKINLCFPCPNVIYHLRDKTDKTKLKRIYRNNIKQVIKLLKGKIDPLLKDLNCELKNLIREQRYEEAITVRNRILRLESLNHKKIMNFDLSINRSQVGENLTSLFELVKKYFPDLENLKRIECFDVSSLSQREATASMVVFTDGLMSKDRYRRFKIKDLNLTSDLSMLEEVLKRRFKQKWQLPKLIIVDGGVPQVATVKKVLTGLRLNIPAIGVAKTPDRLVIGRHILSTVRPANNHPGFNLIRLIRDESHRFARKYHLLLRRNRMMI